MPTQLFGLIGKTLKHSFSKQYFTEKFAKEGIRDKAYELFEIESIEELPKIIEQNPHLVGLNVTIPYKQAVLPFLNFKSQEVEHINACNTIKIDRQNGLTLKGYNTDAIGFRNSLIPLLKPHHKKALVLGTGGASKAVLYVLDQLGIAYQLVSRSLQPTTITYAELTKDIIQQHLLIINTTPLGTYPNIDECPSIPYEYFTEKHLLYDLVYNPEMTQFLAKGKTQGASIKNGLEMLHLQAEAAWDIWQNKF